MGIVSTTKMVSAEGREIIVNDTDVASYREQGFKPLAEVDAERAKSDADAKAAADKKAAEDAERARLAAQQSPLAPEDLKGLKVDELKSLAEKRGVKLPNGAVRDVIVELLLAPPGATTSS